MEFHIPYIKQSKGLRHEYNAVLGQLRAKVISYMWCFNPYTKCSCGFLKISNTFHQGALTLVF